MNILIIVVIILLLVTVFSVQNAAPVAISFLFWKFEASLAIVVFLSVLLGIIAGGIIVFAIRRSNKEGSYKDGKGGKSRTGPGI